MFKNCKGCLISREKKVYFNFNRIYQASGRQNEKNKINYKILIGKITSLTC